MFVCVRIDCGRHRYRPVMQRAVLLVSRAVLLVGRAVLCCIVATVVVVMDVYTGRRIDWSDTAGGPAARKRMHYAIVQTPKSAF